MEPEVVVGTGLMALAGRDTLARLLGPSADYVGQRAKGIIERCDVNLGRVFHAACKKLGDKIHDDASVNPRVLIQVMDEGMFCEDALMAEYLGGILASSRVEGGRDDRGVAFLAELRSMSSYQLRVHYLSYTAMLRKGSPAPNQSVEPWCQGFGLTVCIDESALKDAMAYNRNENHDEIAYHSFIGLKSKMLSSGGWAVVSGYEDWPPFRHFYPTQYGFEFYAWAQGGRPPDSGSYFDFSPIPSFLGMEFDARLVELGYMAYGSSID